VTDVTARGQHAQDSKIDEAKGKAQDLKDQGQQRAEETAEQIKAKAGQATDQLMEQTEEARAQVGGRVRQEVDTRTTDAGEQVETFADALRRTGSTLRDEGQDAPAKLADTAADKIEQVGSYLRRTDADGLLDDVEGFARRKPWAVAGAGAALGLLGARFLKASSERRHEQRGGERSALSDAPNPRRQLPSGLQADRVGDLSVERGSAADRLGAPGQRSDTAPPITPATTGPGTGGTAGTDPLGDVVTPSGAPAGTELGSDRGTGTGTGMGTGTAGDLTTPIPPPSRGTEGTQ
jgi:ElaB/YqjD/DUF883 family membrane-anchored ribosome-binding protein